MVVRNVGEWKSQDKVVCLLSWFGHLLFVAVLLELMEKVNGLVLSVAV